MLTVALYAVGIYGGTLMAVGLARYRFPGKTLYAAFPYPVDYS